MILSILIPTLPSRSRMFAKLVCKLEDQIPRGVDVEILGLLDNKKMSVGTKRNALLTMAIGEFFVFIDDDDDVVDDYIPVILEAIKGKPEVDLFMYQIELMYVRGSGSPTTRDKVLCNYEFDCKKGGLVSPNQYVGPPTHTHVWRTERVHTVEFDSINFGEDSEWVSRAKKFVRSHVTLPRVLYFYKFDASRTETRDG